MSNGQQTIMPKENKISEQFMPICNSIKHQRRLHIQGLANNPALYATNTGRYLWRMSIPAVSFVGNSRIKTAARDVPVDSGRTVKTTSLVPAGDFTVNQLFLTTSTPSISCALYRPPPSSSASNILKKASLPLTVRSPPLSEKVTLSG